VGGGRLAVWQSVAVAVAVVGWQWEWQIRIGWVMAVILIGGKLGIGAIWSGAVAELSIFDG
jgi:hypothetical protein